MMHFVLQGFTISNKLGLCGRLRCVFFALKTLTGRNLGILTIQVHSLDLIYFLESIAPSVSGRNVEFLAK